MAMIDDQVYLQALSQIVDSYHTGEMTSGEFHEAMAELRDKEIESWRREQERPGGEHE